MRAGLYDRPPQASPDELDELRAKYPVKEGDWPLFIPWIEALKLFPNLVGAHFRHPSIKILFDPEEVQRCQKETRTGEIGLSMRTQFHGMLTMPTFKDGKYGIQGLALTRTQIYGGGYALIIAPFFRFRGEVCTVVTKAFRPTLSAVPPEQGGGWEIEIPSCGHRPDMSFEQSVREELLKETNFKAIGEPIRLMEVPGPFVPGTMSERFIAFAVEAEPLPEDVEAYDKKEGIVGRVILPVHSFRSFVRKGLYEDGDGVFLASLAHNQIAAFLMTSAGYWPAKIL